MEICEGKLQYQVFLGQQLTSNFEIAHSSLSVSSFTILLPSHACFKKPYHLQVLITGRSREIKAATWVPTEMRISAGNLKSLRRKSTVLCCAASLSPGSIGEGCTLSAAGWDVLGLQQMAHQICLFPACILCAVLWQSLYLSTRERGCLLASCWLC